MKICRFCAERLFYKKFKGREVHEAQKFFGIVTCEDCELCKGTSILIDELAELVCKEIEEYEGDFLLGTIVPPSISLIEEKIWSIIPPEWGESLKRFFNREVGKKVSELTGKRPNFYNPDLRVEINPWTQDVFVYSAPLLFYGRYRKLLPVPQAWWGTWEHSVEKDIALPLIKATKAKGSRIHAAGREDIDALMLGNGRPFVIEILSPKKRIFDLEAVLDKINESEAVKVDFLIPASREDIRRLKQEKFVKTYRVWISGKGGELNALEIIQRTPTRVLRRKKDVLRKKRIFRVTVKGHWEKGDILVITAESGTYIKEFVSGDEGRTVPSISSIFGPAKCEKLEVIWIHGS